MILSSTPSTKSWLTQRQTALLILPEIGTWEDHLDDHGRADAVSDRCDQRVFELREANSEASESDLLFAALQRFSTATVADSAAFDRLIELTMRLRHPIRRVSFFCSRVLYAAAGPVQDLCAAGGQFVSSCCTCRCYWIESRLDANYIRPTVFEYRQCMADVHLTPVFCLF